MSTSFKMLVTSDDDASLLDENIRKKAGTERTDQFVFTVIGLVEDWRGLDKATTVESVESILCHRKNTGTSITPKVDSVYIHSVNLGASIYMSVEKFFDYSQIVKTVNEPISITMYEMLKSTAIVSHRYTRYKFNIPHTELHWEVSVFKTGGGETDHKWVRFEIHVPNLSFDVPAIPLDLVAGKHIILNKPGGMTKKEKDFVTSLYNYHWTA